MYKAGFIGADNIDIILYLTRIYVNLKLKTAIVDASSEQLFRYSVPGEGEEELDYRGVDVYFKRDTFGKLEQFDADQYDTVIFNYGFNYELKDHMVLNDTIIVSTDFDRANVLRLKETLDKLEDLAIVKIYRNFTKTKISSKYIDTLLNIKRFKIEKEYLIPYSMDDERSRLLSQYDDIFSFSDISDKLRSFMIELVESHLSLEGKRFSKAIKRAEKGC